MQPLKRHVTSKRSAKGTRCEWVPAERTVSDAPPGGVGDLLHISGLACGLPAQGTAAVFLLTLVSPN